MITEIIIDLLLLYQDISIVAPVIRAEDMYFSLRCLASHNGSPLLIALRKVCERYSLLRFQLRTEKQSEMTSPRD